MVAWAIVAEKLRKSDATTRLPMAFSKYATQPLPAKGSAAVSKSRVPATFAEFAAIWKDNALTQHKQSTQLAVRSQLKKWLGPLLRELCHEGSRTTNGPNVRPTLLFGSEELP